MSDAEPRQRNVFGNSSVFPPVGIWPHVVAFLVLAAVILFSYGNTLHDTGFALDNKFIIKEDPRLRAASLENIQLIFTQDYWFPKAVSGLYRPLTTLSYLFNYAVLGNAEAAAGYHWINVGLHWTVAVLLYLVALMLLRKVWPAFFVAALFATHPVGTESVANMVGRADLLVTAVVLAGLLCYVKSTRVSGWRKVGWLSSLSILTLLGVFCKESAVVVLGVMGLYDVTYRMEKLDSGTFRNLAKNGWRFFKEGYIAIVPPLVALLVVRSMVFGKLRPPELPFVDNPLIDLDFWAARLTAIKIIGRYLWLLVWPQKLSCDYSYNQIPLFTGHFNSFEDWKVLLVLLLLVVIFGVAFYNYRRNRAVFFFTLFFFGTLLPASNLFPKLGDPLFKKETWVIGSIMAERFLYMPMIGFAGITVIFIYSFMEWVMPLLRRGHEQKAVLPAQDIAMMVLSLIMVAYGIRTMFRNPDWENDITLWTSAAEVCPNSFKSHKSLAFALYETDPQGLGVDRMIAEGRRAIEITGRTQVSFLHLGCYCRIKGDQLCQRNLDGTVVLTPESKGWYRESVDVLSSAVKLDHEFNADNRKKELARGRKPEDIPDVGNEQIYGNLGMTLLRLGELEQAKEAFLYGLHISPANPEMLFDLASYYLAKGDYKGAAIPLVQTILIDPRREDAANMLVEIYRKIDPKGDSIATFPGEAKARVNPYSTVVREHICAAYVDLVNELRASRHADLANQLMMRAIEKDNCPPARFQAVTPEIRK